MKKQNKFAEFFKQRNKLIDQEDDFEKQNNASDIQDQTVFQQKIIPKFQQINENQIDEQKYQQVATKINSKKQIEKEIDQFYQKKIDKEQQEYVNQRQMEPEYSENELKIMREYELLQNKKPQKKEILDDDFTVNKQFCEVNRLKMIEMQQENDQQRKQYIDEEFQNRSRFRKAKDDKFLDIVFDHLDNVFEKDPEERTQQTEFKKMMDVEQELLQRKKERNSQDDQFLGVIYDHLDNIYEKNDDIDNKREYIKAKYQNGHTGYNRVKREKDYIEKLQHYNEEEEMNDDYKQYSSQKKKKISSVKKIYQDNDGEYDEYLSGKKPLKNEINVENSKNKWSEEKERSLKYSGQKVQKLDFSGEKQFKKLQFSGEKQTRESQKYQIQHMQLPNENNDDNLSQQKKFIDNQLSYARNLREQSERHNIVKQFNTNTNQYTQIGQKIQNIDGLFQTLTQKLSQNQQQTVKLNKQESPTKQIFNIYDKLVTPKKKSKSKEKQQHDPCIKRSILKKFMLMKSSNYDNALKYKKIFDIIFKGFKSDEQWQIKKNRLINDTIKAEHFQCERNHIRKLLR